MAATSKGIRAGKAYVELSADNSKLQAALKAAKEKLAAWGSTLQSVGTKVAAVGAAMTMPFVAAAVTFSNTGDAMAKMARRTGLTTEAVSELAFAADLSGSSMQELEYAIKYMQKNVGGPTEETLYSIANEIAGIDDASKRTTRAMEVFGRSGAKMLPMLMDGAAGLEVMRGQARRLGLTLSKEDAAAAEVLNDALGSMKTAIRSITMQIGAAVAPAFERAAMAMAGLTAKGIEWVKQNRSVIMGAFKAGLAVTGVGVAVLGLGLAFKAGAVAMGVLSVALAAVMTPIGMVAAAVVGLVGVWSWWSGSMQIIASNVAAVFGAMKSDVELMVGGIADALAAGDIGLAAEIMWTSLRLVFERGKAAVLKAWAPFKAGFLSIVYEAWAGLLQAWYTTGAAIQAAFAITIAALKTAWAEFSYWHQRAVEGTADAFVRAWIWAEEKAGKISKAEADERRKYAARQNEGQKSKLDDERQTTLAGIDQQRDKDLAATGIGLEGALEDIRREEAATLAQLTNDAIGSDAALQARLDELSAQRAKLLAKAGLAPKLGAPQIKTVSDYDAELAGAGKAVARSSVAGAFGADSARLGASGGKLEQEATKQRELQEKTLAVLKEMLRKTTGYAVVG